MDNPEKVDRNNRFETMRSQVEYCNDLVRTTMNFLRQSPTGDAPFNINSVIKLCLDVARPQLISMNVAVVSDFDAELDDAMGDMVLVRQAVLNLIYNACQAMEDQPGARQLRIQTFRSGNRLCVAIQDSGPGIAAGQEEVIFDALFTTKGNQGTGLGLAVVRNVMERHIGTARLESQSGCGARFVLEFPLPSKM